MGRESSPEVVLFVPASKTGATPFIDKKKRQSKSEQMRRRSDRLRRQKTPQGRSPSPGDDGRDGNRRACTQPGTDILTPLTMSNK